MDPFFIIHNGSILYEIFYWRNIYFTPRLSLWTSLMIILLEGC